MNRVLNLRYFFYPFLFYLFGLNQARNIFGGNKSVKRKLGEYINDNSSRKRLNGKQKCN